MSTLIRVIIATDKIYIFYILKYFFMQKLLLKENKMIVNDSIFKSYVFNEIECW